MEYKMVVLVRKDLKVSEGKLAVQVAHAAVTCALELKRTNSKWFNNWNSEGQKKVVLKVEDETELREFERLAKTKDLIACTVQDAGLTEVPPGTTTCLGIGPAPEHLIDGLTGDLPLW
jgi:PTH2 family peptidyl-tRNA hydrolase